MVGGVDVGSDPVRARSMLAVVPQRSNLDRSISIRRNLTFHAAYHGVPAAEASARADELLEQFGLRERGDVKPDLFSGGQAQRVMIARALMHEPQVLFLDEPTTGLDPAARLFVWDRLRELRERGVTLFLTTHDMHEAATAGRPRRDHGPRQAARARHARGADARAARKLDARAERPCRRQRARAARRSSMRSRRCPESSGSSRCPSDGTGARRRRAGACGCTSSGEAPQLVAPAATLLAERGLSLSGVELGQPTLEDVFIHLTGRTLR